jgi:hypothetical protein
MCGREQSVVLDLAGIYDSAYAFPALMTPTPGPEGKRMATKKISKKGTRKKISKKDISLARRIEKAVIKEIMDLLDRKRPARKPAEKAAKKAARAGKKPTKKTTKRIVKKTAKKMVRRTASKIARRVGRNS